MATYRYIGTMKKPNGKVDVVVPKADGTKLRFNDVTPEVDIIDVGDDVISIKAMDYAVGLANEFLYERTDI